MAIKKALHVTIPWLQVLNKFLKKCSQTMGAITKGILATKVLQLHIVEINTGAIV